MPKKTSPKKDSSANIGFEAKLWLAADKLRNSMDAAEYKHVVLGLIFLKYIFDSFEEPHAKLIAGKGDYAGANPEEPDEYKAENIFWVPPAARWSYLQNSAKQPAGTFRCDFHSDLRADYVLANCSMSSNQSGEGEIRQKSIEADLVDCMVAWHSMLKI